MTVWLLSTCVLIAALILLRLLLRGRVDPRLTYALWLLAAVRILIPGSLFPSPVSVDAVAERSGLSQAVEQARYVVRDRPADTAPTVEPSPAADPTPALELSPDPRPVQTASPSDGAARDVVHVSSAPVQPEETAGNGLQTPAGGFLFDRFAPLRWVWAVGAGLTAAWFLFVNARFAWKLRRSRQRFQGELPVDCPLPVYVVPGLPSPCLFGFFRPAVYLNPAAVDGRLDHILTHELSHYRHKDHWWAMVRCACIAAQWFNPLVWAAAWLSRQDCELACDATAVGRLGEAERLPYGCTLVGMIAAARAPASVFHTATTMNGTVGSIQERITLIARKPKMTVLTLSCALLVAAVAAGCAFGGAESSPAEVYLANTSEEQIFNDFIPATTIFTGDEAGFTAPDAIPAADLWDFYTLMAGEELNERYDQTDKAYHVPASEVTEVLDQYLEGYVFDPAQWVEDRADYDPETETFTFPACGSSSGRTDPVFYQARALTRDTVEVEFADRYGNNMVVTGRITDDGVRYLGCVHTDYSTYGAQPISTNQAGAWRLNGSAITEDYLTELIVSLEMEMGAYRVPDGFLFSDPQELTDEQLFQAFCALSRQADRVRYWDETTRRFYFPADYITGELQKYFKDVSFDITRVRTYDTQRGCAVFDPESSPGGELYMRVKRFAVDGNLVNFTVDFYTNNTMTAVWRTKNYSMEFYEGGYYYLSASVASTRIARDYATVIQDFMDTWDKDRGVARGVLCDLDGNGTQELVLCYEAVENNVDGDPLYYAAMAVLTMDGGEPVRFVESAHLGSLAGAGTGGVMLVGFQGARYLCGWSRNAEARLDGYSATYKLLLWDLTDGRPDPDRDPYTAWITYNDAGEVGEAGGTMPLASMNEFAELLAAVQAPEQELCRLAEGGEPLGFTLEGLLEAVTPDAPALDRVELIAPGSGQKQSFTLSRAKASQLAEILRGSPWTAVDKYALSQDWPELLNLYQGDRVVVRLVHGDILGAGRTAALWLDDAGSQVYIAQAGMYDTVKALLESAPVTKEAEWQFDGATGTLSFWGEGTLAAVEAKRPDQLLYSWADLAGEVTTVDIGEGITRIPDFAFRGFSRLTTVNFPITLTSIGQEAFYGCAFEEMYNLPLSLKEIGAGAFAHCEKMRAWDINTDRMGVSEVTPALFNGCMALRTLRLPEGAVALGEACLEGCQALTVLVVPPYVAKMEDTLAPSLQIVVFEGEPPEFPWDGDVERLPGSGERTFYYPQGSAAWREVAARHQSEGITWVEGVPEDGV